MRDRTSHRIAIRITRIKDTDAGLITLRVEGRVVSEAVGLLEGECSRALETTAGVEVDFAGVTFIDGHGVAMLKRFSAKELRVVNCPAFVEHLLYGARER